MYHIAKYDLGVAPTLVPQIPFNALAGECPFTPRVCFAPTVDQCVIGMVGYGINPGITILGACLAFLTENYHPTVYHTDELLVEPEWVEDFHITHEEWALSPITVERIGYLDYDAMVKEKRVDLTEDPRYGEWTVERYLEHLSEADCDIILKAIKQ